MAAGETGIQYLDNLNAYAEKIGLAFQVQDDILDITGDTQTLGKPQGSDLELNKSTYFASGFG
ncbi:octaprenyl diphosphate synthase [Vibrio sp. JCM 19236]|nr:octaprenyl diphosphate synthase [Vibrio sp. JCM 19236]